MSAQHTPGPWAYEPTSGAIYFADGDVDPLIASTNLEQVSVEQGDADGRLIAAAPDLYEALSALIPNNLCLTNDAWSDETIIPLDVTLGDLRKAAAALAKAAGAA